MSRNDVWFALLMGTMLSACATAAPRPVAQPVSSRPGCMGEVVTGWEECERWYNDPGSSNFLLLAFGDASGSWKTRTDCKQAIVDKLTANQEKRNRCIEEARRQKDESERRLASAQTEKTKLARESKQLDASIAKATKEGKDTKDLLARKRELERKERNAPRQQREDEKARDEAKQLLDDLCSRGHCNQGAGR